MHGTDSVQMNGSKALVLLCVSPRAAGILEALEVVKAVRIKAHGEALQSES